MSIATEIITIGDEILIGQTVDTNSAWLGQELDARGLNVVQVSTISDDPDKIRSSIDLAIQRADLILITGGLGPTSDDRTKETIADYFNMPLVENKEVLKHIHELLGSNRVPLNDLNIRQAMLPKDCILLKNRVGTAAGMLFKKGTKVIVSMPGVPYEMKSISKHELFPWLEEHMISNRKVFRMVMTTGYPESVLAQKLENWESNLPTEFSIAYLPSPGMVKLRISCACTDLTNVEEQLEEQISKLMRLIPKAIYSTEHERLEETIGRLMRQRRKTVATAESCTGGMISQLITAVPGSSDYFLGGIIAYDNRVKKDFLGVNQTDLVKHGAVSETVVRQMAQTVRLKLTADYGIATSGIAGPGGGSIEKPVGLIWIAVASERGIYSQKLQLGKDRGRNITRSSLAALNLLRLAILDKFHN